VEPALPIRHARTLKFTSSQPPGQRGRPLVGGGRPFRPGRWHVATAAAANLVADQAADGGAVAGRRANEATTVQSTEYLVQSESGRRISVIRARWSFGVGARVQVIQSANGTTRLAVV
jgi:hypothetical protein